jgi:hypothetical protein
LRPAPARVWRALRAARPLAEPELGKSLALRSFLPASQERHVQRQWAWLGAELGRSSGPRFMRRETAAQLGARVVELAPIAAPDRQAAALREALRALAEQ